MVDARTACQTPPHLRKQVELTRELGYWGKETKRMAQTHQEVLDLAEHLGVIEPLAEARRLLARAADINRELAAFRSASEADHGGLIQQILAGPVDRHVIEEQTLPSGAWIHDGPGARVMVAAVAAAHRGVEQAVAADAASLWEPLVARVAEIVAESNRLRLPPGIGSASAATRAGLGNQWNELEALLGRWHSAHRLAGVLRTNGWVAPSFGDDREVFCRYKFPALLPAAWWNLPAPLVLNTATDLGAVPGLYTAEDAEERWRSSLAARSAMGAGAR
jgi:hypothetical protein